MCEKECENCLLTRFRRPAGGIHDAPTVICTDKPIDFPGFSPVPIEKCDSVDQFTPKNPTGTDKQN